MRVQRDENGHGRDKAKPDIVVRCGPRQNRTCVTDPLVIVEVPSPGTMDRDRGPKPQFCKSLLCKSLLCKSLPALRHIVLVCQDPMRVEPCRREAEGWLCDVLTAPDHTPRFDAVEFETALDRIYLGVPVLPPIIGGRSGVGARRAIAR